MKTLAQEIAQLLTSCQGEESAMTAPRIAEELDRPEREIRRTISESYAEISRAVGGLIISKPGAGFFITTDADQIAARWRLIQLGKQAWNRQETDFRDALKGFGLEGVITLDRRAA